MILNYKLTNVGSCMRYRLCEVTLKEEHKEIASSQICLFIYFFPNRPSSLGLNFLIHSILIINI